MKRLISFNFFLLCCFTSAFSCQSIYEADRIDPINPYGIYSTEDKQPFELRDARKMQPVPDHLVSYSYKPVRSSSGKVSKTSVRIIKNGTPENLENSIEE